MEERDERKTMMLQALAQMELQPLPARGRADRQQEIAVGEDRVVGGCV